MPVIPDLIEQIPGVVNAPEFAGLRAATLDLIERSAWSLRFRLERLLADDLAGMFDRETSKHVVLHPKLTTFDISALPEDGPATSMVMVVANAWLMGMLTHDTGWRTNFIAEEGWHLLGGPGGRVIRSKSKLSRGLGVSIVAAIHHISDIPPTSEAIAMIKEAQTIHLFRQEHDDDIADCVRYFNLEASNAAALGALPQGDHLLKVGTHKEIRVHHRRTAREEHFTATDSAMLLSTNAEGWLMSRRDPQLGRSHQRPGILTAGQQAALIVSAAALALLAVWHLSLVLTTGVPLTGVGVTLRGLLTLAPLDLPARYGAADPVTTLTVFALFLAAAVAVGVWWATRTPRRHAQRGRVGGSGAGPAVRRGDPRPPAGRVDPPRQRRRRAARRRHRTPGRGRSAARYHHRRG